MSIKRNVVVCEKKTDGTKRKVHKMKKLMLTCSAILASTLLVGPVFGQTKTPVYVTGSITVPASATSTTVYPENLAYVGAGGVQSYRELKEIMIKNQEGSLTGQVFVASHDLGVETILATYTDLLPETSTGSSPTVSWIKESSAVWVVTNDVPLAVTNVVTGYKAPTFRELSITVTNLPSTKASTLWYMIKAD